VHDDIRDAIIGVRAKIGVECGARANTVDIRWLSPGYDANGNEILWNDANIVTNSYFIINKFKENDAKNRFIGQASISYDVLKNLTVKGTVTRDFYNYNFIAGS